MMDQKDTGNVRSAIDNSKLLQIIKEELAEMNDVALVSSNDCHCTVRDDGLYTVGLTLTCRRCGVRLEVTCIDRLSGDDVADKRSIRSALFRGIDDSRSDLIKDLERLRAQANGLSV